MALPKEPRQKMINIMYLVLTALLALNVSAEILNAFKTVDNSLMATNKTINASTETIMKSFEDKIANPGDPNRNKALIWYPKAQQAQKLTADMYNYIQDLRGKILKEAGFNPNAGNKFDSSYKLDDLDIATRIMIDGKEGPKLKDKLEKYKAALLAIDDTVGRENANALQISTVMPATTDKSNKTWEDAYFHMVPAVASVTILSKFQNDVKTAENRIISAFHEKVGQVAVRFDSYGAIIGQSSNYLMPGQEIEITAGVGAFSKSALPVISIAGTPSAIDADGKATLKMAGGGVGQHSIPVHIQYKDQEGNIKTLDKNITYTVGQSSSAIELPEMNVLYIGYPNKIKVSASGVGAEKINISASGGGASPQKTAPGEFIVNVSQQGECIITASADGKTVGANTFRVRNMPAPLASVGGKRSGDGISAGALAAQPGVACAIENFPLNLQFKVVRFKVVGTDESSGDLKPISVNGSNLFNKSIQEMIRSAKPGDIITVEDIYAVGPDGKTVKLPSLLYNIL